MYQWCEAVSFLFQEKGLKVTEPGKATMPIPKELYFLLDSISQKGKFVVGVFDTYFVRSKLLLCFKSDNNLLYMYY